MKRELAFVNAELLLPHSIAEVHYGVLSSDDTRRLSVLPCRRVTGGGEFGVSDARLGVCDRNSTCLTCGLKNADCVGHAGHIDLEQPVFHLGFFNAVLRICRTICKRCSHVMLTPEERDFYLRKLRRQSDPMRFAALVKSIQEDAYKTRVCANCGSINGTVKRARPLRIVHERYKACNSRHEARDDLEDLYQQMAYVCGTNKEIDAAKKNVQDFMDPVRVRELFRCIPPQEVLLLGLRPGVRPVDLLVNTMLVPPVCVRPSGPSSSGLGIREDELTVMYNDILTTCDALRDGSLDPQKYVETWDMLQLRCARILDSALPGFPQHMRAGDVKSYAQRMKGKHGRFRGNLSGKRVDFSGRSVISPDPNLAIDELAVPLRVARVLTYPQRVFRHNLDFMRRLVINGPNRHPGAVTVTFTKEGSRKSLHSDREAIAAKLSVGDIVERHVINGDLLLFNRQPSLHRISMMCHRARVLPYRTLRFNECCCAPYNADFDGDEMNIHLVQTEEARAEALTLMLTSRNIIAAKNGEPIIACTQDFLTASFLVTSRDVFLDRAQFCQGVSTWLGERGRFDLPFPAILKPVELWTGKQLYDVIIKPRVQTDSDGDGATRLLDLEATAKFYTGQGGFQPRHQCREEGFVSIMSSKFISGRLDKKLLGGGAKDGLFARLYATSGGDYAAVVMHRIAQFTSRWLMNYGFSLGLSDVSPTPSLEERKKAALDEAFGKCAEVIVNAQTGQLAPLPGLSVKQTLEAKLNEQLSNVRDVAGTECLAVLTGTNAPLIMTLSGSKGSALNIAQMMACVGQQTVSGKRVQNAFLNRSLPHFPRFAEHPAARGFVANSFFSSLTPTEFFFHTMAGREGLVDTAVKTAETGYIYRRLMKAMEDLSVKYDYTVRNSKGDVVQLRFGEDMLDPQLMEGPNGTPINFASEWLAVTHTLTANSSKATNEPSMMPQAIMDAVRAALYPPTGPQLSTTTALFQKCSAKFKADVERFFAAKVKEQRALRAKVGLPPDGPTAEDDGHAKELLVSQMLPLTHCVVDTLLRRFSGKYASKICEPGTPCGAIAAQSVGEPSTQMTLRTFHFAGVASMSITQGVPRLVEIINANRCISTPVIYAPLRNPESLIFALGVKARMERVALKEVTKQLVEVVTPRATYIQIILNRALIHDLQLDITAATVRQSILGFARKAMSPLKRMTPELVSVRGKFVVEVYPFELEREKMYYNIKSLLTLLPDVVVGGIPGITRVVVTKKSAGPSSVHEVVAEGAELRAVMNLPGVDGRRVVCNHVAAVERVLGIEASRAVIVSEIQAIMRAYSLSIDIRHVFLLADVMTYRGSVLGITRYGIQKMNSGVLTMASFERTTEHLYNAAVMQRADTQLSVSENVIVGCPVPLGTNSFTLLHATGTRAHANASGIRTLAADGAFHLDVISR
jgi:DNA-directed RNA polymerase III subunit RPC1